MAAIKTELVKYKFKTTKSENKPWVDIPTGRGSKVTLYLPAGTDRTMLLGQMATFAFGQYGGKFEFGGNKPKSSAGWISFAGSPIIIVAKIMGKVNKGLSFEANLEKDLINLMNGVAAYNHPDFIKDFEDNYLKKSIIKDIENTGKKNTPRPLKMSGSQVYVSVKGGPKTYDIGESVADLIVRTTNNGKQFNLSLKYGSTVTFFNSGIQTIMTQEDFKKGTFDNPIARALIELFSIDEQRFIDVFKGYTGNTIGSIKIKAEKKVETVKVDTKKLQEFIKTVIGKGYLLVHLDNQKRVHITEIDDAFLNSASKPVGDTVKIEYPVGGSAKRIDIRVETGKFFLNFNIRNKQGGIYPSHIMCDYKMK